MPGPTHRTTATVLRLRSSARIGDNITGRLPMGTLVEWLRNGTAPWVRVQVMLSDGVMTGWVSRDHLEPLAVSAPTPVMEPPWLPIARAEIGVVEHPGAQHNPRIVQYHQSVGLKATDDETPWCSSFANWCMKQAGLPGTNSAAARSWLTWGRALTAPVPGCIAVFSRGTSPTSGHVAFYLETRGTGIQVLGGNQSNSVKVSSYPSKDVLAYRWPRT